MRRATEKFRASLPSSIKRLTALRTSESTIVDAEALSFSYSLREILHDISFQIHAAEIVAVMGRNGAGKSTLLKSLAGLHKPSKGKIRIVGKDPIGFKGKDRTDYIGYIPQEPSDLLFNQSVGEECRQADLDNRVSEGTTLTVLNSLTTGIAPTTHPRDLSEGQRLALAMSVVLSARPRLLILDEPTRGLDYQAKGALIANLSALAKSGTAVILATHDVELVAEIATRVIFLADGEIVSDGTTIDVLLSSPAFAPQVAKIMSPAPWLTVKDVVWAVKEES